MHPVLQSCEVLLRIVRDLIAGVLNSGYGEWGAHETDFVSTKAARQRLLGGLKLAEAYLRRVLVTMALELEPTLVEAPPKPLRRPREADRDRARLRKSLARCVPFQVFKKIPALPEAVLAKLDRRHIAPKELRQAKPVFVGTIKAKLELLSKIAANPLPRARRLAFYLARSKHGRIIAPGYRMRAGSRMGRLRRLWNTQTSATYDAMGFNIRNKSEQRPPPLSPKRRYGPSIIVLGG